MSWLLRVKTSLRHQIHVDTDCFFQCNFNGDDVEERRSVGKADDKVKVAALVVRPARRRSKHPSVRYSPISEDLSEPFSVAFE